MLPTSRRGLRAPSAGPPVMGHSLDSHEFSVRRASIKTPLATNRGISVDTYLLKETKSGRHNSSGDRQAIPTITCEFVDSPTAKPNTRRVKHSQSHRSFDTPYTRPQIRRMSLRSFSERTGSFTRPSSPISIDMARVPSRLTHLHRSPDHHEPTPLFDTTFTGTYTKNGFRSSSGIILTDVALNQTPDLVLSSPSLSPSRSKSSASTHSSHKIIEKAQEGSQPIKRSLLARVASRLWKRFSCAATVLSKKSQDTSKDETISQSSASSVEYEKAQSGEKVVRNDMKQDLIRSYSHADEPLKTKKQKPNKEWTLLDFQREKEKQELLPSRYIEDIKVLHNIHRREMVSKLLYREEGQLFYRRGTIKDPHPPLPSSFLLAGPTPPPPLKRNLVLDPLVSHQDREKILQKMMSHKLKMSSAFAPIKEWSFTDDTQFLESCLRAHNLYRARHSASPLKITPRLCLSAQFWANRLAQTGHLFHRRSSRIGENLFCRNVSLAIRSRQTPPDISGDEVAAYWYSNVRDYRFNLEDSALQAHAGSFSQMVWVGSRMFGVGKALSRGGKLIVVAHYFPPGNITGKFRQNVLSLSTRALATEMMSQGKSMLKENLIEEDRRTSLENQSSKRQKVSGVLAAQPPNIIGRNATKILAAHMLGHAASVVTTPEDKLDVVIIPRESGKRRKTKQAAPINYELKPIPKNIEESFHFHTPRKLTKSVSLNDVMHLDEARYKNKRKSLAKNWPASFNYEQRRSSRAFSNKLVRTKAIEIDDREDAVLTQEPEEKHSSFSSNSLSLTNNLTTHISSSEGYLEASIPKCSLLHSINSSSSSSSTCSIPMFVPKKCKLRRLRFSDELAEDSLEPIEPISLDPEPEHVPDSSTRPQFRLPHSGQSSQEGFYNSLALSPLRY